MRRPHSENRMHIILASSRFLCVFWDTFFYCWYCCCCFSTVFLLSLKNIYCTNDDDVGRCCVYMSNNTSDIHAYNIKITIIIIFIFGIRNENKQLPYLFNVSELCFFEWRVMFFYIFFFSSIIYTQHTIIIIILKQKEKKKQKCSISLYAILCLLRFYTRVSIFCIICHFFKKFSSLFFSNSFFSSHT